MAQFNRPHIALYYCMVRGITTCLSRIVSDIFNVE